MSSPSDFAKPEIKFKKLASLPSDKPYSFADVMAAMKVLHKMIHAQAKAYGGKGSKLLQAGIAESALLKSIVNDDTEELLAEGIDDELDKAYAACIELQKHMDGDDKAMELLLDIIRHVNSALALFSKA